MILIFSKITSYAILEIESQKITITVKNAQQKKTKERGGNNGIQNIFLLQIINRNKKNPSTTQLNPATNWCSADKQGLYEEQNQLPEEQI